MWCHILRRNIHISEIWWFCVTYICRRGSEKSMWHDYCGSLFWIGLHIGLWIGLHIGLWIGLHIGLYWSDCIAHWSDCIAHWYCTLVLHIGIAHWYCTLVLHIVLHIGLWIVLHIGLYWSDCIGRIAHWSLDRIAHWSVYSKIAQWSVYSQTLLINTAFDTPSTKHSGIHNMGNKKAFNW